MIITVVITYAYIPMCMYTYIYIPQDPVNYEFSYEVQDAQAGLDFGHREMRKDDEATGSYHVLLPDGRTQYVDYVADGGGYRPMIRYEGTASYPAHSPAGEGYKYKKK